MFITKGIPTMPPGRVWTALFERGPDRYSDKDLPRSYDAVVTFKDRQGREYDLRYRLDLDIFFGIRNLGRYDIHHAAEALREIRTTLARWTDGQLLVGHKSTQVTETVYRHQLRPVLTEGAEAMDELLPANR